ncbi:MAG: HesA/MoeB/ThiF family protein [Methanoregulaceae archaeon]|nr:HesA/MoeB/ThiF family protein [Methanoregulaceae archaeon]
MLSCDELERYHRQIMLFGEAGQEKLKSARVVIAGAGGLGCPVATYLAVAGVGHLRIIDHDTVDRSNLNRQILHWDMDTGRAKTESAGKKLQAINPDIEIEEARVRINEETAPGLVRDTDAIVDAMDNYPTRYLLNHLACKFGIPLFHGAIRGFDGQVTTIIPGRTACLSCIFPKAPPKEIFPVIGVTAGIIGLIQANEVIKYLLGTGELLENRLLIWDGLHSILEEINVERDQSCIECSQLQSDPMEKVK